MNGVLKRTIADANPTAPMIVDFSINGSGKKISNLKIANPSYTADVVQQTDYYPYGMVMPNRNGSDNSYRYGFQGQEKDDEVKGAGESYTTKFRQYDPRVGRWLSIDPKATAWESPYVSMGNNPIIYNDPLGDTVRKTTKFLNNKAWMIAYERFASSPSGKRFLEDYEVGGKYEHISVVFDIGTRVEAGYGGRTVADAIPRKGKENESIELDGVTYVKNSATLANNEEPNYFLRFTIEMNPYASSDKLLYSVKNGAALLHETQHVKIGTLGLYNVKKNHVPHPKTQHLMMSDPKGSYSQERRRYWLHYRAFWERDFQEMKKESEKGLIDKNPLHYYPKVFTHDQYIQRQDSFKH